AGVVFLTFPAAERGRGHGRGFHRDYSLRNIAVTAKIGCVTPGCRGYESSNISANTCAWLSSTSFEAVMSVRRPLRCRRSRRRNASARSGSSSSSRYRRANSSRLSGSCEYHFRSSVEGATVLSHSSHGASSLRCPRGQTRSTKTVRPRLGRPSCTRLTSTEYVLLVIPPSSRIRPSCASQRCGRLRWRQADRRPISMAAVDVATPKARAASPRRFWVRFWPSAWSSDIFPGPSSASAYSAAIMTALNSHPPLAFQTPLGAWTFRIAVSMTPISAELARGVARPAASMAPPAVSVIPAAKALRRAGRISRDSIIASVPSRPGPLNRPWSFCKPWPTNSPPITVRIANFARPIASSIQLTSDSIMSSSRLDRTPRGGPHSGPVGSGGPLGPTQYRRAHEGEHNRDRDKRHRRRYGDVGLQQCRILQCQRDGSNQERQTRGHDGHVAEPFARMCHGFKARQNECRPQQSHEHGGQNRAYFGGISDRI